jgi:SET domain-containing protein
VFALRAIPKGTDPLKCLQPLKEVSINRKDIKKLDKGVKQLIKAFCYYRDDEVLVSTMGLNTMNIAFYLNHSKEPNLRMKKDESFEALRDIAEGEELLMDYDHSFGETHIFS